MTGRPTSCIVDALLGRIFILGIVHVARDGWRPALGQVRNERTAVQVVGQLRFFVSALAALLPSESPHASVVEVAPATSRARKPVRRAIRPVEARGESQLGLGLDAEGGHLLFAVGEPGLGALRNRRRPSGGQDRGCRSAAQTAA